LISQLSERLPVWAGTIRLRLAVLYSLVIAALAAVALAGVYVGVSRALASQPVSRDASVSVVERREEGGGTVLDVRVERLELEQFEGAVNDRALAQLRLYSLAALAGLFVLSVLAGWLLAGRALRPVGRITRVAQEIQAGDLSRRIGLRGPRDEIRELGETFDAMLGRLEKAFATERRLIHEVSHELRNPLAVLRTSIDVALADDGASAGDLRETLTTAQRTTSRLSRLVDDLFAVARREAEALRDEAVDIGALAFEVITELRVVASQRGLTIDPILPCGILVIGDALGLRRALANLLDNAVRLAPLGTSVRVTAGSQDGRIFIAVADEGPGIAEDDQELVFRPHWHGRDGQTPGEGRSGLGLAIARQIAEAHRGTITLVSRPGVGSTFTLWLPAASPPAADGLMEALATAP
jgi:signal transduction histidine kinase